MIKTAIRTILEQSAVNQNRIACLTIRTIHFVNVIVEHNMRRLSKVAIIRLLKSFMKEMIKDKSHHLVSSECVLTERTYCQLI